MHDVVGDLVHTVVVVAVLGEVALHRVVHHDAVLVPDGLDLGVLDGAQGVGHNGQARDAGGEPAGDLLVVQGHLNALVAVLVVHVVDDVQRVHIHPGQPLHHVVEALHHVLVVQVLVGDGAEAGAHLLLADFVHAAVDGVQQALGQVGAGAEELHLLAHPHAGHAAGDGVVVAVGHPHQVVVLILDGAGGDAHLGAVALEGQGQPGGPEHGHVGFGSGAQVLQSVQVTEAHLGDQGPAVDAHAADGLGNPGGVAAEQGVVLGGTGELDQTQLHDEVVHHLLNFALGEGAVGQIALGVDVQEGAGAAQAHGGAVLLLHRGQVAEVQPLDGLLGVLGGLGDVEAVDLAQLLQLLQSLDLLAQLLALTDHVGIHDDAGGVLLALLVLDQAVHAVQGHAAVVADDAAAAVGVGQTGDDVAGAAGAHLGSVSVEHALVVGLAVFGVDLHHFRVHMVAVVLAGLHSHADAAVGLQRALKGLIGLEAHDLLLRLVQITGTVGSDGGDDAGVHVQHAAGFPLLGGQVHDLIPQLAGLLGGTLQEALVALVGGVVLLDEVPHVDLILPDAGGKILPFLSHWPVPSCIWMVNKYRSAHCWALSRRDPGLSPSLCRAAVKQSFGVPQSLRGNTTVSSILKLRGAYTAWGLPAGITST